jgi:PPK2 family polyphosphate:nucleotide phosphotransferase
MTIEKMDQYLAGLKVPEAKKISLKKYDTNHTPDKLNKAEGEAMLQESVRQLSRIQDKLYADNRYSMLIVLQAMDAAGKDGAVRHVMSGLNPTGVKVSSFKTPSSAELDHDYFWRHYKELPARGEIGLFNRSHYENVLITKVHPEFILNENLPGINSIRDIDDAFWQKRYKQIKRFEKNLAQNGTIILKFFLHVSKEEQKKRFLERIENPDKNWKFSAADIKERGYWNDYQSAYEQAISHTSTKEAPWFIIPADNKWFARLAIGNIIGQHIEKLDLAYPTLSKEQMADLQKAKAFLMAEKS